MVFPCAPFLVHNVSIGVADLCVPTKGQNLVCLGWLEQVPEVSLLLSWTQVECRPSWAPPISIHTLLSSAEPMAIGVKAHCLRAFSR